MIEAVIEKSASKKSTLAKPKRALAPALAKRAKALHEARLERLETQARDLVAQVRQAQRDIGGNLVEIGLALVALKDDGLLEALRCTSFEDLCRRELSMSLSTAKRLITLATRVSRDVVARMGQARSLALLALVEATPEDDTPEELLEAKLALPSGKLLVVADATAEELQAAAREIAEASGSAHDRRTRTTRAEQTTHRRAAKRLESHGFQGGKLLAGSSGGGARVRYDVPIADLRSFARALLAATKDDA